MTRGDVAGEGITQATVAPTGGLLGGLVAAVRRALDRRSNGVRTLSKFLLVGAGGYVAYQTALFVFYDSALLWFLPGRDTSIDLGLFTHGDTRLLMSTLLAGEVAIICSFTAHSFWTFRDRLIANKPVWMRFSQFNAKALVSTGGIMTVVVNFLVLGVGLHHVLAVPIGVLVAFGWNWAFDSQLIFRRASEGHGTP